jgi:hypothetical protein
MTMTMTVTATTTVGITVTATTNAALSSSAATTDLSVEFGAATKYHRRTAAIRTARLRVQSWRKLSCKAFDVDQCAKSIVIKINGLKGATSTQGVRVFNSTFPSGPF